MVAMLLPVVSLCAGAGEATDQRPGGLLGQGKGCTIETRPLSFGIYDPLRATALDGHGLVIFTCGVKIETTSVKNVRIELSRGQSGSYDRRMIAGEDALRYNVYLDATRRTVWGDGSNGTDYYLNAHPPNKTPVYVPAYGRIFPLQDVSAGQYADTLTVTIQF